MTLTAHNKINLDKIKSLEMPHGFRIYNFEYEKPLRKELRKLGIEIDYLGLENQDSFRITIYPSREWYVRRGLMSGIFDLERYIPASEYSKLEEEYQEFGDKNISLKEWSIAREKLKEVAIVIPRGDYADVFLREFHQGKVYIAKRGWSNEKLED